MELSQLVTTDSVVCNADISSKKRALEFLAELLAKESSTADAFDIFQHLTEREKLGSTSLGHGVALPHARTSTSDKAIGAFIKLEQGIDFDSPDNKPTDLLFALMVPEHYTDEHLKILASLASCFSDEVLCHNLRTSDTSEELYKRLTGWHVTSQAS
ncbi:MAG: PTS sugar transporter subunit IIA [Thiotrichales bacterium]|nr:MAG: PTS sugar transporter subunit IIA [Thiotrichales bacterium]